VACRGGEVPIRIKQTLNQQRSRFHQHPGPEPKLFNPDRILRLGRKPLRPAAERGAARPQRRLKAARNRLPGRRQIRHQDAPRHPVHRKMMDRQQQPPRLPRPGIEPHRLQHHAGPRRKPALGASSLFGDAGVQRRSIEPANINPPEAG
jgi:hypothetical protein